jgi:hypothetical protein
MYGRNGCRFHAILCLFAVNEDGSLRRIANWPEMSEKEKETTVRVLTKRNAARLKKIKVPCLSCLSQVQHEICFGPCLCKNMLG